MSAVQSRIELFIDVFEEKDQRALVLPTITGAELVQEILQAFRTLGYLSDNPGDYQLLRSDQSPLENAAPVGKQLANRARLVLVEHAPPLPEGAQPLTKPIYLREEGTGSVHKLGWQPAIIGRPDPKLPHNELIAVNLAAHERGLRVSRRHAQITEENGQFHIQRLSENQTTIKDDQGTATVLNASKHPLEPGQIISLDASQIALRFIVREKERG